MVDYLFEFKNGELRPIGPRSDRQPDGDRYLTDDQAAARSNRSIDELRAEWVEFFRTDEDPAVEPDAVPEPHEPAHPATPAAAAREAARLAVIRRVRFKHIVNDDHWAFALEECKRLGVDVADVWIKLEHNDDTDDVEPKIITTLLVLRRVAERTRLLRGERSPVFCGPDGAWVDVWTSDQAPREARAVVLRKDSQQEFEGIATFKQCASWTRDEKGNLVLTKAWRDDPAAQLGKCARVAAYRVAFGAYIGGLMSIDENHPDSVPKFSRKGERPTDRTGATEGPGGVPTSDLPDDPRVAIRYVDDSTPDSERRLQLELVELGVPSVSKAAVVVDMLKRKFPRVLAASIRAFCAVAMKCVKDNPAAYGVVA